MATFGNTTAETTNSTNWANYKAVDSFALSETGLVSKLTMYCDNLAADGADGYVKATIYSNSGSAPSALLATGSAVAIANDAAVAWVDLPFASSVRLTAGTYWLGLIADANMKGLNLKCNTSGGYAVYNIDTYSDGPTDPFGTTTADGPNRRYAIYATYTTGPWTFEASFTNESISDVIVGATRVRAPGSASRHGVDTEVDKALWQIAAGDATRGYRDITDEVDGLTYSNVRPGGAASCSFSVSADVWGRGYNELQPDERLIVRYAGTVVWDGYILPRKTTYQGE